MEYGIGNRIQLRQGLRTRAEGVQSSSRLAAPRSPFSYSNYLSFLLPLISLFLDAHLSQFQSQAMNKRQAMYVSQRETVRERLLQSIARRASETSDSALCDTRRGTCESDRHSTSLYSPTSFSHFTPSTCFSETLSHSSFSLP